MGVRTEIPSPAETAAQVLAKLGLEKGLFPSPLFQIRNCQSVLKLQYATPVPDEYDVEKLNRRVKAVAPAFDNYPGLFFKLYAVMSPGHWFSSIYLWAGVDPMRKFLVADRFHNYAEAFARPSVRYWLPFVIEGEVPSIAGAKFALRQTVGIPRTTKVGDFLEQ